ncbi:MAG: PQQ-dependent sugar dehydrogenase [Gammaproteobacteria bacterium]
MNTLIHSGLCPSSFVSRLAACLTVAALAACGNTAELPVSAGIGPDPKLPPPESSLLPTVDIAPAIYWPKGVTPVAAQGLSVTAFATGLDHPRWLHVLPNGDVLVAETNAPEERPLHEELLGIRAWIMDKVMKRAGAAAPSANRITLLRDADGDGVAEVRSAFIEDLNSPFGMALVGNELYVANTDALMRFPYKPGETKISATGTKLADLPGGPLNHHWTKGLIASADGAKLYVSVGSNSNVAEHGMAHEKGRAAIWEFDRPSGQGRLYASGLRNPVGLAWQGNTLWVSVNERDEIGSDLVPDYMTSVREGGFYGWPYSYYGQHVDERVKPPQPDLVAKAIKPDYALGPHTASLGLTSAQGSSLPEPFKQGMFVGQHGSWNRDPLSGYKVIFVPFSGDKPSGMPVDVLSGFVNNDGDALGRPVGVAIDKRGSLLVADDVGNVIWRVSAATTGSAPASPPAR